MANPSNPTWRVPGGDWLEQVNSCRRLLVQRSQAKGLLAIADLLKILPLNPTNSASLADIAARGELAFTTDKVANAATRVTRASFLDDNVGSVRVTLPKNIAASVTIVGSEINFESSGSEILFVLSDLPSSYPFSGNFVLTGISLTEKAVHYRMKDQVDPFGTFDIFVDLTQMLTPVSAILALATMPLHRRRKMQMAFRAASDEDDRCIGGSSGDTDWVLVRDSQGYCRLQHTNEFLLGNVIYGPSTLDACRAYRDSPQSGCAQSA